MLFEDAVEQFMQAMVLKPNAQGVLTYLAIALLGCGREREVVRLLLRDARGVEKPRGALYALALALAKKGESEKACELLMKSRKGWRSSVGSTLASIDIASRVLYDWRYGQEDEKEGSKKSS
jgi:predicted Zn-dependent protease